MSEAKFTNGPWKFNAHDGSITDFTKAENEVATAQLDDWHCLGMGYSNAYLIAAAPEMYELLESISVTEMMNGDDAFSEQIKELLAKARGES